MKIAVLIFVLCIALEWSKVICIYKVTDLIKDNKRSNVKMIVVEGTHYEVGKQIGTAFSDMIQDIVKNYDELQLFRQAKATNAGQKIYVETLEAVEESFPEYLSEMRGTANGAGVNFSDIFLLHMNYGLSDNEEVIKELNHPQSDPEGCSVTLCNHPRSKFLAHTEDGPIDFLNHTYIVHAKIRRGPKFYNRGSLRHVLHENFIAFCYAGHLGGYTFGLNELVAFSVNIVLPTFKAADYKIPRMILLRALLTANSIQEMMAILNNSKHGTMDGISINAHQMQTRHMANIEVSTKEGSGSIVDYLNVPFGTTHFHANSFQHNRTKDIPQLPFSVDDSQKRINIFRSKEPIVNQATIIEFYGAKNSSGTSFIFREPDPTKTDPSGCSLVFALFNFPNRTLNIYPENPKEHPDTYAVVSMNIREQNRIITKEDSKKWMPWDILTNKLFKDHY